MLASLARAAWCLSAGAVVLWAGFSVFVLTGDRFRLVYPPELLEPSQWRVLAGEGRPTEEGFALETPGPRGSVLAGTLLPSPVDAAKVDRIELQFVPGAGYFELSFGWSRSETLSGYRTHPLEMDENGLAVLYTDQFFGWEGEVHYFVIRTRGSLQPPLVIQQLRFFHAKPDFVDFQRRLLSDWFEWRSWNQISANRTLVGDGNPLVSPVLAVAAWLALSGLLLVLWYGGLQARDSLLALVLMIALGWIVLDLRWQAELIFKARATVDQFSGKSLEEKRLSELDGPEFMFMEELKSRLENGPPGRLLILSEFVYPRLRARYHALPLSARVGEDELRRTWVRKLEEGDHIVLMIAPGIHTDSAYERNRVDTGPEWSFTFELAEVAGADAILASIDGAPVLALDDDGRRLVRARLRDSPPPGYYRARVRMRAAAEPGTARVRLVQRTGGRTRDILAERDFEVGPERFAEYSLAFPVLHSGAIMFVINAPEEAKLQATEVAIETVSDEGELIHLWSGDSGPYLVARRVLESDAGRAFEIR